ncbi:MAG: tetratricopeptide repeat protein [Yoonia sp.]|uniref:tetratricopeptide repeat protein n=1 Tax=Yoonia sp. TaxID=2212373 RepID=UPI003EF5A8C9
MNSLVIFDGADVLVRAADYPSEAIVVSFSALLSRLQGASSLKGFGENAFHQKQCSHVVFISKTNHWWQTDEMDAALEAARAWLARHRDGRVVSTYGASMGAYGALMYADDLGANHALALAPQFSIDPEKVPWERRWLKAAARTTFIRDDMHENTRGWAKKFVVFDPYSDDGKHAKLFTNHQVHKIRVPFGSHAIGNFLKSTGELKHVFNALMRGRLSVYKLDRIAKRASAKRRNTDFFYNGVMAYFGRRLAIHHRTHAAIVELALARNKLNAKAHYNKALSAYSMGDVAQAEQSLEKAREIKASKMFEIAHIQRFLDGDLADDFG